MLLASSYHNLLLRGNEFLGWGKNEQGQLGMFHTRCVTVPTSIPILFNPLSITSIKCHKYGSLVLTDGGIAYESGIIYNVKCELYEFKKCEVENITKIECGSNFNAIISNNHVFCWGQGIFDIVGYRDTYHKIPVEFVQNIYCGGSFVLISTGNALWIWGRYGSTTVDPLQIDLIKLHFNTENITDIKCCCDGIIIIVEKNGKTIIYASFDGSLFQNIDYDYTNPKIFSNPIDNFFTILLDMPDGNTFIGKIDDSLTISKMYISEQTILDVVASPIGNYYLTNSKLLCGSKENLVVHAYNNAMFPYYVKSARSNIVME